MASRSHLQQEGPLEASEDYRCAICLDNINNMACVVSCFHRFCSGCIQRWATRRPVCPLCRQPIDRVLHTVRADDNYQEYVVGSSSHWRRRRGRERSRSRSPLRHRQPRNDGFPERRSSMGSGQVSRSDAAPGSSSTSSQQAPATNTSGERSSPRTGERTVSPGDGEYVCIGILQLPPLRIQLPNQRAQ
ncbi:E3 ubiquitin-protein ligase Topors-like [Numida meleagris]|uniref:E3 ubiquitin-protein ligase Topors-like n=1 Tax=Numida meleagris TaxID=8996 RepID=UPI000B3DFC52|nr:E3 ubiquitin-protein ligase Topors-like [Numida meleagris]